MFKECNCCDFRQRGFVFPPSRIELGNVKVFTEENALRYFEQKKPSSVAPQNRLAITNTFLSTGRMVKLSYDEPSCCTYVTFDKLLCLIKYFEFYPSDFAISWEITRKCC